MTVDVQHPRFDEASGRYRVYPPDALPQLQCLLSMLADIDVAYEKNLDTLERSSGDEALKRRMITELWESHQKRRAFFVTELEEMQARLKADLG